MEDLKKWIVEQRNMAHVHGLEESKQAYNSVLAHMESLQGVAGEEQAWREAGKHERFAEWLIRNYYPNFSMLGYVLHWTKRGHYGPPFFSACQLYKQVYKPFIDNPDAVTIAPQIRQTPWEAYQIRVRQWVELCFGVEIANDIPERNHRFVEEALELVQSLGCAKEDVLKLVDYVYDRPVGEPHQEVGGVMVTLASLCAAAGLDIKRDGEKELERIYTKVDVIRKKQAAKPKLSPLPEIQQYKTPNNG